MGITKHIAVICNYRLDPDRVGGMDHFFWAFHTKCKENHIVVDWFFPNQATHGGYKELPVIAAESNTLQAVFLKHLQNKQSRYSHIITHFVELCTPFFKAVKQQSAAKVIAVDHNPRPIHGYPFKKRLQKKIKGWLYARYIDQFIGVSNYTVNEIIKDFGKHLKPKCKTIYNGVIIDHIQTREERAKKAPAFLVASHLRESKGIQDLIVAVSKLEDTIKNNLQIDIYGDGPYRSQLEQLVTSTHTASNFCFKGNVPNLNEIYQHYDYMLQPTYMECFSLSILESLAANVPVVTTNVGGNEEAVHHKENGYIFKAKNITGLQTLLEKLYTGESTIVVNTREKIATHFSIGVMVQNHYNVVAHVL